MSVARSHHIRSLVLDSLMTAQPYGIAHEQLVRGLVTSPGTVFISRDEAAVELDWLGQKALVYTVGEGEGRLLKLTAKGLTFLAEHKPWAKLEVLE